VASLTDIVHVNVGRLHLKHGSGIGQDITMLRMRQHDGEPGGGLAGAPLHAADVDAHSRQPLRRDLPQRVGTDFRYKADLGAQRGQVVGKDG